MMPDRRTPLQVQRAAEKRQRLYRRLCQAAANGEVCPGNAELGRACGYTASTVGDVLMRFTDDGLIAVERRGHLRIVTIRATGERTAPPWSDESVIVRPKRPVREIAETVIGHLGASPKDVLSRSRFKEHVRPRQIIFALSVREGWSAKHVGRVMGFDHSTVLYARRALPEYIKRDAALAETLGELRAMMPPLPERVIA